METSAKNHLGRKISRIRELRGMKQEALAQAMGVSQQTISLIENSEEIDDKRLQEVAVALGVTKEAIKNFSDDLVLNIISNNFSDNAVLNAVNFQPTFNPIDKVVQLFEEKERLLERLLEAEKEKNAFLEKMLAKN